MFGAIGLLVLVIWYLRRRDWNKKCAHCNSRSIKFTKGEAGKFFWEYRNKDGSKDKRVKDNYQQAGYTSEYQCKKCGAKTGFGHFVSKKPSRRRKVWKRLLLVEGEGERTGKDWEKTKGVVSINSSSANRKGK
jgi:hypothetical protein